MVDADADLGLEDREAKGLAGAAMTRCNRGSSVGECEHADAEGGRDEPLGERSQDEQRPPGQLFDLVGQQVGVYAEGSMCARPSASSRHPPSICGGITAASPHGRRRSGVSGR